MGKIQLTRGRAALVDDAEFESLNRFKWYAHKDCNNFYAARSCHKKGKHVEVFMHRVILGLSPGDGIQVDHVSGDGLDNRRQNLRFCNHSQNMMNRRMQKNNTSGFRGVCWQRQYKKWQARIKVNGQEISLGCFKGKVDAAKAYDTAAEKYHGEFARLNFSKSEKA